MTDLTPASAATLGDTSLALTDDLTFDQWAELGRPILRSSASSMWWVGDWLLYAEARWATDETGHEISSERARIRRAVADVASVDVDSLRQARWVAKAIPAGRRRAAVPWNHHQAVAALEPEIADGLLEQAETERWSYRAMRAAVKTVNVLDVDEAPEPEAKPLRHAIRLTFDEADAATVDELMRSHAAQLEKQLALRKVTAIVEVA